MMISTNSTTESRESYLMGDPWSDQVSYTFDEYVMQEEYRPVWTAGDFTPIDTVTLNDYKMDPASWIIKDTHLHDLQTTPQHDAVNHPKHYTSHPSGVECIEVTQHYNFCVGNAIKYLWRAGLKSENNTDSKQKQIEDLNKAIWYIRREIENLETNKYE